MFLTSIKFIPMMNLLCFDRFSLLKSLHLNDESYQSDQIHQKFTNFHHTTTFINDEFPSQCSFLISEMAFLYSYRISWLWSIHIHEKIFNIVTKLYLFHYSDRSSYQTENFHYTDPFALQWQIEKYF